MPGVGQNLALCAFPAARSASDVNDACHEQRIRIGLVLFRHDMTVTVDGLLYSKFLSVGVVRDTLAVSGD